MKKALLAVTLLLFWASSAVAQRDGISSFGAADSHDFDVVNLSTLTPSFNFPAISKSQGILPGSIAMESPQSCRVVGSGTATQWTCGLAVGSLASFYAVPQEMIGMTTSWISTMSAGCTTFTMLGLLGVDSLSIYPFPSGTQVNYPSTCGSTSATVTTADGTGYTATFTATSANFINLTKVVSSSGWTATEGGPVGTTTITDPFGNTLTWKYNATTPTFTDSLGAITTLALGGGSMSTPSKYTYNDTTGTAQNITFTSGTATTLQPTGQSSCVMTGGGQSVTPITAINYPDGTSFGIGWQTNSTGLSGLINSITLRTGGQISYTYGTPINSCILWAYTSLTRTTPDGATTYSASTTSGVTTTTVLDPGKNKTVYTLTGGSGSLPGDLLSTVVRYQNTGTVASPSYTKISETDYCYNNLTCGTNANFPITQLDTYQYTYTPTGTQVAMSHDVKLYDSTYGLLTSDANTDSINSQTITTTYVYGTYSSGSCSAITNTAIHDHICTVTTKNGSTWLSGSTYTYNTNGALTSSSACLSSTCTGSSALTTTYTPTTQGTYSAIQDPNGQSTSFTHGSCNSLMLTDATTTVNSIAIDNKTTWNCDAGLVMDTTDSNSNEDDFVYDSMNRISSYTDNLGNVTSYAYGTPTLDHIKITDPIGVVSYAYNDGLGRPTVIQMCQTSGCSNYDTGTTSYAWNGVNFETKTYVPCTQTVLNTPCTTVALTSDSNPIAGPTLSTDTNSGTLTSAINSKDLSVTAGPHPSQENTKVVQTEIDGFGRITSTCALESSGGTSCGQTMGNSGILTSNTYSFATGAPKVVTTRGSQSHTSIVDALGRPTSLTLPETGATARTWSYDSQSSSDACTSGSRNSYGDLLRDNLPDGTNYVCYIYDGLHRLSQVGNSGTSHTINPCKRFKYDSTANGNYTTPTGYPSSANIIGRLMEVSTDDCGSTKLTDEWFAYDKEGRMTDMFEWTPNSGGYYHTTATYDADGVVTGLSGIPSSNSYTWGLDGEDRPNSFTHNSTTVISATAGSGFKYDAASRPTNVPVGTNGDQDTFTFDNVGNMTEFTFSVNSTTDDGKLTWNSIGSLNKLVITDGFNSGGTQTCTYGTSTVEGYDDVGRLLDANCGSTIQHDSWTYDQYDNATRTGNPGTSWNPGYSSTTNQYTLTGATYDSNGNNTYDGVNTYSFDLYGKMSGTISGNHTITCGSTGVQCATYDALGRLVEASNGSAQQQILLSPIGRVAYMSGQTVGALYVDMPWAGAYLGTASDYYLHPDWLGTKRLTTSVSGRTATYDVAYTPYGETYDSFGTSDWKYLDFTGDKQAIVTGLWDTDNRELFVNSSRWLSPDPCIGCGGPWSKYAYVTDPNTQTDPSGLQSVADPPGGTTHIEPPPAVVCGGLNIWCWLKNSFNGPPDPGGDAEVNPEGQHPFVNGHRYDSGDLSLAGGPPPRGMAFVQQFFFGSSRLQLQSDLSLSKIGATGMSLGMVSPIGGESSLADLLDVYRFGAINEADAAMGVAWGDHYLSRISELARGYGSAKERTAAEAAITEWIRGNTSMELIINDNKVLRSRFVQDYGKWVRDLEKGGGTSPLTWAGFREIAEGNWDQAIKTYGRDALLEHHVGTWKNFRDPLKWHVSVDIWMDYMRSK